MGLERWRYTLPLRLRSIFRSSRVERDLDDEIRDHLERQIEAEMKLGASADEARQKVVRAFGGVEQRKEECRDARRVNYLEHFLQDLRLSVRALRQYRGFTTAAMLTLTLGIGINVAMFTVVNGVLLQAMPFPQPDRLVLVSLDPMGPQRGPFRDQPAVADRDYLDYRRSARMFARLASFTPQSADLNEPGEPTHLPASMVTPEFFSVLQVEAAIGRTFGATELPATPEVVISDKLWRDRFSADPGVVGRSITLDGVRRTVIGVMPAGFDFPSKAEAWVPLEIRIESGISLSRPVIGRLVPGASVQQAQAELEAFARSRDATPGEAGSRLSRVLPLKELLVRDVRTPLAIFSRRRVRPADRVRQHRQPAVDPRGRTPARDGRANGARRQPGSIDSAVANRECGHRAGGRRPRPGVGRMGRPGTGRPRAPQRHSARRDDPNRHPGDRVRDRSLAVDRAAVLARARPASDTAQASGLAPAERPVADRATGSSAGRARRQRDRACARAAYRRGVAEEFCETASRRSGSFHERRSNDGRPARVRSPDCGADPDVSRADTDQACGIPARPPGRGEWLPLATALRGDFHVEGRSAPDDSADKLW
jgi:hypothetical protein